MSVNSHLESVASSAVLSANEKSNIQTSISTIQSRLNTYFGGDLTTHFQFGSSTRGTILPRSMDSNSDIDYMIVFSDSESKPQTYIDRLKRFANHYYGSSEIAQSHPTVVLKLNHIMFDLVPAITSYLEEYRIPAPNSSYMEWMATSPTSFNTTITDKNTSNNYKIKPCVRLLKYWNARSGYVFDSYSLEQWVAGQYFFSCSALKDYFFQCLENLSLDWNDAQWRKDRLARAKQIVANTKQYERNGYAHSAETEIKKLIP